jgi:hypothetical protein
MGASFLPGVVFPHKSHSSKAPFLKTPTPTYFQGWNQSVFRQAADGSNMKV